MLPVVEDGQDVGVHEPGDGLGLLLEPRAEVLLVDEVGRQDLDRHMAAQGGLHSLVDERHAALPDPLHDLVGAEALTLQLADARRTSGRFHRRLLPHALGAVVCALVDARHH